MGVRSGARRVLPHHERDCRVVQEIRCPACDPVARVVSVANVRAERFDLFSRLYFAHRPAFSMNAINASL